MGERANVIVQYGNDQVVLYSHWAGEDLIKTVHKALSLRERWNDFQYLTAIIFRKMIQDYSSLDGTQDVGISNKVWDSNYPSIIVNVDRQKINLEDKQEVTFADFVEDVHLIQTS